MSHSLRDGSPAADVYPACSSNDTLVAALYLMNYRLLKYMVAIACENKIDEFKRIQQKVSMNSAEILAIYADWKEFHDPQRWDQHTVDFPKFRSAVNFVHNCVTFDEAAMTSRIKQLRKEYEEEEEEEENEEGEEEAEYEYSYDDDVDEDAEQDKNAAKS